MICDKVGRKAIADLEIGEIGIYTLPSERAKEVARVTFSQMKKLENMDFESIKMDDLKKLLGEENFKMMVPNETLTIAFRKTKDPKKESDED